MPGEKSSDFEVEIRINQVLHLMIRGYRRRSEIFQYIAKMNALSEEKRKAVGWEIIDKSESMIDEYIKRATEKLKEANSDKLEEHISLLSARLEDIYRECMRKGKEQTANQVVKNMMYLRGIGGFNIKGKFDYEYFDIDLSDEEIKIYKDRLNNFYGNDLITENENKGENNA